ncbi:MAG TPA: DUF6057 family protein, partial [Bacteroidota bacterium]|nr:DUF6057 family protein [Bacteroidota bacterium]
LKIENLSLVWRCAIGTLLVLSIGQFFVRKTYDKDLYQVLQVDQAIKEYRWHDAVVAVMQCSMVNPHLSSQTNAALFHSNVLLDRLFSFPQFYGSDGLVMNFEWCSYWPEEASSIYWDLGLINESLHWAHEALEEKGATPAILERLGMIYLAKGNGDAAKPFLFNLKNIPFHETRADHLLMLADDSLQLAQDSVINVMRSRMISENIIALAPSIPEKLELLLKKNYQNKMAFEYLMAFHLMNGNLQGLLDHFSKGKNFGYTRIPRHIQEALLVIAASNPGVDKNQLNNMVQPITFQRFTGFQQVFQKYQGNRESAKPELQRLFGDTYWYYLVYVRPDAQKLENQNEFQ